MIIKEIDKKKASSHLQKAGDSAEKQMAHYLKRAFQDSKDIHVINDLRLVKNDDTAQIDHLIIHRFGFIVIESKSVSTELSINDHGEWTRTYKNKTTGMPSPIKQAERQADFLEKFLDEKSDVLLKSSFVLKIRLSKFKYEVLVAISDSGIIDRPNKLQLAEVHKADQIVDEINSIVSAYEETNNKVLTLKIHPHFADSSMNRVKNYLFESHKPKNESPKVKEIKAQYSVVTEPSKPIVKESKPTISSTENEKNCDKCKSKNIAIVYGKYGYYMKCSDCNGNASIDIKCKTADCKARLRKQKLHFYKECVNCDSSELYFVNSYVEQL